MGLLQERDSTRSYNKVLVAEDSARCAISLQIFLFECSTYQAMQMVQSLNVGWEATAVLGINLDLVWKQI
jgi:hypothetical protein